MRIFLVLLLLLVMGREASATVYVRVKNTGSGAWYNFIGFRHGAGSGTWLSHQGQVRLSNQSALCTISGSTMSSPPYLPEGDVGAFWFNTSGGQTTGTYEVGIWNGSGWTSLYSGTYPDWDCGGTEVIGTIVQVPGGGAVPTVESYSHCFVAVNQSATPKFYRLRSFKLSDSSHLATDQKLVPPGSQVTFCRTFQFEWQGIFEALECEEIVSGGNYGTITDCQWNALETENITVADSEPNEDSNSQETTPPNLFAPENTEGIVGEQPPIDTTDGSRTSDGSSVTAAVQAMDSNNNERGKEIKEILSEMDNREKNRDSAAIVQNKAGHDATKTAIVQSIQVNEDGHDATKTAIEAYTGRSGETNVTTGQIQQENPWDDYTAGDGPSAWGGGFAVGDSEIFIGVTLNGPQGPVALNFNPLANEYLASIATLSRQILIWLSAVLLVRFGAKKTMEAYSGFLATTQAHGVNVMAAGFGGTLVSALITVTLLIAAAAALPLAWVTFRGESAFGFLAINPMTYVPSALSDYMRVFLAFIPLDVMLAHWSIGLTYGLVLLGAVWVAGTTHKLIPA